MRTEVRAPVAILLAVLVPSAMGLEIPKRVSLVEAIQIARRNSPILGAANAELSASRAAARAAKAGAGPQISANGFATSGNNSSIMGSSPMVEPPVWMLVPTGSFVDGNLALMIPIFAPRLRAMAGSADWQVRASWGEISEATADLDLHVTEAYNRILLDRQLILADEASVTAAGEFVRTTQARFDAGKGIEAEVQRSQAELARVNRSLISSRNDEQKAEIDLAAAINVDLSEVVEPTDSLVVSSIPDDLKALIAKALRYRGLVIGAKAKLEAASDDVRSADAQRRPQLYASLMGDATNRTDVGGVSAGLTLSMPLFDGGRISAEVARARSMVAKARANVRQAEITVEKEVRQAWLDVRTSSANAASSKSSVTAAQAAYDITALRVSAGKSILIEQLDALDALTRAKADLAQSVFDETLATARLRRAVGGQL